MRLPVSDIEISHDQGPHRCFLSSKQLDLVHGHVTDLFLGIAAAC
jgi:hypothetical protein